MRQRHPRGNHAARVNRAKGIARSHDIQSAAIALAERDIRPDTVGAEIAVVIGHEHDPVEIAGEVLATAMSNVCAPAPAT